MTELMTSMNEQKVSQPLFQLVTTRADQATVSTSFDSLRLALQSLNDVPAAHFVATDANTHLTEVAVIGSDQPLAIKKPAPIPNDPSTMGLMTSIDVSAVDRDTLKAVWPWIHITGKDEIAQLEIVVSLSQSSEELLQRRTYNKSDWKPPLKKDNNHGPKL
jgi:hypothetical protein